MTSPTTKAPAILTDVGVLGTELTRRTILKGGASTAAALGLGALWPSTARATIGGPGGLVARSDLLMLVNRVSQGFTAAEYAAATTAGYSTYLANVITGPGSDPAGSAFVANLPQITWTPQQCIVDALLLGLNADDYVMFTQQATIGLSVLSSKILLERTMDMWTNRLNVYGRKPLNGTTKLYGDYAIIRPNALGNADALFTAFARDTSALYYLDNVVSAAPIANENWAREFLELYTMGQNDPDPSITTPNYIEADVQAAAQAFTGWSWDSSGFPTNPNLGLFLYQSASHITTSKVFQGITLTPASSTTAEGDQVVSIVVNSSKTARTTAYKILRHFLRYDPSPTQVTTVAAQYPSITAMIGAALAQSNVTALTQSDYLFSSPSRFVYQALRASGAVPDWSKWGLIEELRRLGNAPFEWPAPDGYPDEPGKWAGGLFARWEFANKLFTEPDPITGDNPELPGVVFTDTEILAMVSPFTTTMDIVNNIDARFTGGVLSVNEKSVLDAYINVALSVPLNPYQILREVLALTVSSPTFQYY